VNSDGLFYTQLAYAATNYNKPTTTNQLQQTNYNNIQAQKKLTS